MLDKHKNLAYSIGKKTVSQQEDDEIACFYGIVYNFEKNSLHNAVKTAYIIAE